MITIRRASAGDAGGIAAVHVEAWRETYRGLIPDAYLDRLDVLSRTRRQADRLLSEREEATFVAESAGGIVGFAICGRGRGGPDPRWGEVQALYLLDRAKGRGGGRRLMASCSRWLEERGRLPFLVWVLTANFRAIGFYRHLGGRPAAGKLERFGTALLPETALVFDAPIAAESTR